MKILIAIIVTLLLAHLTPVQAQINNSEPTQAPTETVEQPVKTEIPTTPVEPVAEPVVQPVEVQVQETPNEAKQFIYFKESSNRLDAVNEIGACGLGQSLPCSKLENDCPDWRTNYACQDAWFTNYMQNRYGTWENARAFWIAHRWW